MKILHFITSLKFGGAESALYNYLAKVVSDTEDQHVVAYLYDGPNVDKIKNLGIPVFKISGRCICYSPLIFLRLKRLITKIKPDVLHSSLWSANIISRIVANLTGVPLVCDLHGSSVDEGRFRNFLDRLTASFAAKNVAVSESVRASYSKCIVNSIKINYVKNRVAQNLIVIKNGINFEQLREKAFYCKLQRADLGLVDNDFVVGTVGRLEPIKSYDVLIRAFYAFYKKNEENSSNLKLVIIGNGSQFITLQQLSQDLGLSNNVIFTGFRGDAYRFYQLFDCFAISSKSEGLSISLLEALSFGLPVISTHYDKQHDVVKDKLNGFLVKPMDVSEYAQAINALYSDPTLRSQISACNLKLVAEQFSIQKVVNDYRKIYLEFSVKP
ncbi:MAG: Glycosyl transferase group 1 [candidate division TM6 bacterium GW2011_GWF2_36_6]|nr:MAG: Glycosyl transferase group 1 [candidate division TM6 bacterium GW2011_GWF2_36_6]